MDHTPTPPLPPLAATMGEPPTASSAASATSTSEQLTCDALCSLGQPTHTKASSTVSHSTTLISSSTSTSHGTSTQSHTVVAMSCTKGKSALAGCPKSHQLPMFLSKTYHMIDRCEPTIATWSVDGSNFVVKNVEKFASAVLPLYFKHSNFSSFARQLNFYGFRKLRTDPILTSDVDPRTACYVRFYHEKFQKDRPELLHQIKRATKSDQQSKDEVESLKQEVSKLKEAMGQLRDDTDRRLAEMSYECNRRITGMGAEYDKLAAVVQQLLHQTNPAAAAAIAGAPLNTATTAAPGVAALPTLPAGVVQSALRHNPHAAAIAAAAAVAAGVQPTLPPPPTTPHAPPVAAVPAPLAAVPTTATAPITAVAAPVTTAAPTPTLATAAPPMPPTTRPPDLMQSLSQAAAISLQQQQQQQQQQQAAAKAANITPAAEDHTQTAKRPAEEEALGAPEHAKQKPATSPPPATATSSTAAAPPQPQAHTTTQTHIPQVAPTINNNPGYH